MEPRYKTKYKQEIIPALMKELGDTSVMAAPKLLKITLNMGVGEAVENKNEIESAAKDLTLLAGQKVQKTYARKSISNFKIREGMAIGVRVTLRGDRMYEFLDRLINVALPRVRDFRGVPTRSFDGRGNYTLGVKEHIIFPEIKYDKVDRVRGLDICFSTNAGDDARALALFKAFGMPFRKSSN